MAYLINRQLLKQGLHQLIRDRINILEKIASNNPSQSEIDFCVQNVNQCLVLAPSYLSEKSITKYSVRASKIVASNSAQSVGGKK